MTIRPVLKQVHCSDHDPIEQWTPDGDGVCYWLELSIGLGESDAADIYQVMVTTPVGLAKAKQSGIQLGPQPPIVINPYSWEAAHREINRRLVACTGHDWLGVQTSLRRSFHWEYER